MKTIRIDDAQNVEAACAEFAAVLCDGGLVCMPCAGRYRVLADLTNTDAVLRLMQSKGRVKQAPSLVFIHDRSALDAVADGVDPLALRLASQLWPQPLTVRVTPTERLPEPVLKQLGGRKTKLGVRVPSDPLVRALVNVLQRPLLVSSANRERKAGETSPAQVRKTFNGKIDLFLDRGDLKAEALSTVIDVKDGQVVIERPGAISAETLQQMS
jgi:L-threonylcarbamoyladenylate synthase